MSVAFEEMAGSPKERWSGSGLKVTRKFLIDWADKDDFTEELVGTADAFGADPASDYPGYDGVFIVSFEVVPFTDDVTDDPPSDHELDLASYTSKAVYTVEYESRGATPGGTGEDDMPSVDEGTILVYRQEYGMDVEGFTGQDVVYESTALPPEEEEFEFLYMIPVIHHNVSWQRVLRPPFSAIRALSGHINSEPFLGAGKGLLLFEGAGVERQWIYRTDVGPVAQAWRVDMSFSERRVATGGVDAAGVPVIRGWNWKFKSHPKAEAGWEQMLLKDDTTPYKYGSFAPLFVQEARPIWLTTQGDDQVEV